MDQLFGIPISQLTLSGIALVGIALVVTALITGRLIPKSTHDREMAALQDRVTDYKELWQIADRRGDVMETVASDLVVVGENMNKVLKSLPSPHQEGVGS